MIQIPDIKDLEVMWKNIEKINDRTKIHTKKIKELEKQVKELKK
jgi:hypothetical protein